MTDFGRRVAAAAANVLPKTGQTTSYADYDDGYYEKGWDVEDRFVDNEDGTVTDNATGLMWVKDVSGVGANNGARIQWLEAIAFCEALDFAGHQDWRMPNILELTSITDFGGFVRNLYDIFDNIPNDVMWASSTWLSDTTRAWAKTPPGQSAHYLKTFGFVILSPPVRTA